MDPKFGTNGAKLKLMAVREMKINKDRIQNGDGVFISPVGTKSTMTHK
jgi:hypothetical protein